jgi:Haem-degrading
LSGTNNPLFAEALRAYVRAAQGLVDPPHVGILFMDGTAFSNRAIGNLARPFFPDGDIFSGLTGPLSKPATDDGVFAVGINEWSPFNVGLQLDLVALDVLASLGLVPDRPPPVTDCSTSNAPSIAPGRLANGIQIFPGSVPIYKAGVLVGALGISGDGVDQDDMVAFLGVHRASLKLCGTITNAPAGIRADKVTAIGLGLRYVQCPVAPFIDSDEQTPCGGK